MQNSLTTTFETVISFQQGGVSCCSVAKLSERAGYSKTTIKTMLNRLEDRGYITKIAGVNGEPNKYVVIKPLSAS